MISAGEMFGPLVRSSGQRRKLDGTSTSIRAVAGRGVEELSYC